MRKALTLACLLAAGCAGAPRTEQTAMPVADNIPARADQGRALADSYQAELFAALSAAMAEGGPVGAMEICAQQAPAIAARLSAQSGAMVRRTALRVRNPAAAPDAHERRILEQMAAAPRDAGGNPVEWSGTTDLKDTPTYRYMRAIPTGPLCLTCHGEEIAPDVRAAIARLYPGDQATGFRTGDLRGAFSISWPAAN